MRGRLSGAAGAAWAGLDKGGTGAHVAHLMALPSRHVCSLPSCAMASSRLWRSVNLRLPQQMSTLLL